MQNIPGLINQYKTCRHAVKASFSSCRRIMRFFSLFSFSLLAHNKVKNLVQNAKKWYFRRLVENNKDPSSVWLALNTFTKGTNSRQKEILHHFTADAFNDYFLSIGETLAESQNSPDSSKHYSCSKRLVDFCQQKTKGTDPLTIPLLAVHEMGKYISLGWTIKSLLDLTKSAISCLN